MEELITAGELAKMLRVSPSGFWRLKKAGKLPPSIRIGARERYRVRDIEQFVGDAVNPRKKS